MIYLAINENNDEVMFQDEPKYDEIIGKWYVKNDKIYFKHTTWDDGIDGMLECNYNYRPYIDTGIVLPIGTIERLTNIKTSFKNKPIKISKLN